MRKIPIPVLNRLPKYLRTLRNLADADESFVSSSTLGAGAGVKKSQVRKDLENVNCSGRPGKGYYIPELITELEELLGLNNVTEAVVVGAGRLGRALSQYPGFSKYGLEIVALLDNDPQKIGTNVGDVRIVDVDKLMNLVRRMAITLAVVTVPAESAQKVADDLVAGGVRAIWNFAPTFLEVPPHVHVQDEDLAVGLANLSHHVAQTMKKE